MMKSENERYNTERICDLCVQCDNNRGSRWRERFCLRVGDTREIFERLFWLANWSSTGFDCHFITPYSHSERSNGLLYQKGPVKPLSVGYSFSHGKLWPHLPIPLFFFLPQNESILFWPVTSSELSLWGKERRKWSGSLYPSVRQPNCRLFCSLPKPTSTQMHKVRGGVFA